MACNILYIEAFYITFSVRIYHAMGYNYRVDLNERCVFNNPSI